jgi:RNA polymerase sigma-70 factor (ECF subfamily)
MLVRGTAIETMRRGEARLGGEATDEELLASEDPEAFAAFYARHLGRIESFFARRVDRQTASDLAAETFAAAFVARRRFVPGETPAVGWLFTIAARRLVDLRRRVSRDRRAVEALTLAASRSLATPAPGLPELLDSGLLRHLPRDQRTAVVGHVVEGLEYAQLAAAANTSEASIRQRVSRGLKTVRGPLEVYRAAQALSREDRPYRYGGGHGLPLESIRPREALDCSAAASLVLARAGLFDPGPAWSSGRLAESWGEAGEGRYMTVWANAEHVFLEFRLDSDRGQRFDPTPSRFRPHRAQLSSAPEPGGEFLPRHWPGY